MSSKMIKTRIMNKLNPKGDLVLLSGEIASFIEDGQTYLKVGDGATEVSSLPYVKSELPESLQKMSKNAESCIFEEEGSLAVGNQTSALCCAFAAGSEAIAQGYASHAEGDCSQSNGDYSHAEGWETYAYGNYSHSEGDYTKAYKTAAHSEGCVTSAFNEYSHAEGAYSEAHGWSSHTEGGYTSADGDYAHAEGYCSIADGFVSHSEGLFTAADRSAHSEGACTAANDYFSHAEGDGSMAGCPVKVGQLQLVSCVTDPAGHQTGGTESYDSNYSSISVMWKITFDTADGSAGKQIADLLSTSQLQFGYEGDSVENNITPVEIEESGDGYSLTACNFAKIPGSMMWSNKIDLQLDSIDEDDDSIYLVHLYADKNSSSSVGSYFSDAAPTPGKTVSMYALNTLLPTGSYLNNGGYGSRQHAEGLGTTAAGRNSHAEGERTRAFGSASHSEGYDTTAIGRGSRVNGVHSFAEGKFSTAVGKCVNSKGDYSIAAGNCCTASHVRSFVWSGPYTGHNTGSYTSKGNGTFCINPDAGLSGFFIGADNFIACVLNAVQSMTDDQKQQLKAALGL